MQNNKLTFLLNFFELMNVKLLHAESAEYAEKQYKSLRPLRSPRDLKFNQHEYE